MECNKKKPGHHSKRFHKGTGNFSWQVWPAGPQRNGAHSGIWHKIDERCAYAYLVLDIHPRRNRREVRVRVVPSHALHICRFDSRDDSELIFRVHLNIYTVAMQRSCDQSRPSQLPFKHDF
eukprot:scaffold38893_cov37-Prasinocladus_malaysianus.AAC.1